MARLLSVRKRLSCRVFRLSEQSCPFPARVAATTSPSLQSRNPIRSMHRQRWSLHECRSVLIDHRLGVTEMPEVNPRLDAWQSLLGLEQSKAATSSAPPSTMMAVRWKQPEPRPEQFRFFDPRDAAAALKLVREFNGIAGEHPTQANLAQVMQRFHAVARTNPALAQAALTQFITRRPGTRPSADSNPTTEAHCASRSRAAAIRAVPFLVGSECWPGGGLGLFPS